MPSARLYQPQRSVTVNADHIRRKHAIIETRTGLKDRALAYLAAGNLRQTLLGWSLGIWPATHGRCWSSVASGLRKGPDRNDAVQSPQYPGLHRFQHPKDPAPPSASWPWQNNLGKPRHRRARALQKAPCAEHWRQQIRPMTSARSQAPKDRSQKTSYRWTWVSTNTASVPPARTAAGDRGTAPAT